MPPLVRSKGKKILRDEFSMGPYTEAQCPLNKPSTRVGKGGRFISLTPHSGWKKFEKKYPSFSDWIKAHSGEPIGRLLTPIDTVVYFSYSLIDTLGMSNIRFNFSINRHTPVPKKARIYPTYQKWVLAQEEE